VTTPTGVSIVDIVDRLGMTFLSGGDTVDGARTVSRVTLHEGSEATQDSAGAVVLGAGLAGSADIATAVREYGSAGAVALIVKEPLDFDGLVEKAVADTDVALLGMVKDASWLQSASLINEILESGNNGDRTSAADADLFDLANSIAQVLNGPVTIENQSSRILAFSADQAFGDEARKQSVLGHQVPQHYSDRLRSMGYFNKIYGSTLPVFLPGIGPGVRPRVGMRIHAASQILGSIWVILDEEPNELQVKTLVEAAGVAAMSLLRAKLAADSARRLRLGEVITLLSGGTSAKEAAERLGYGRSKANVLAAGFRSGAGASLEAEADVDQLALTLNTYLDQVFPLSVAAAIGGTVYAVIPHTRHQTDDDYVRRIASEFADRSRSEKSVVIGIGATVADVMTLEKSRDEADRALRVLRSTWNSSGRTVARADDVQINSLLLRLSDALADENETASGPLAVLREYDRSHDINLVDTLRAWLDTFGDIPAAASLVHIHVNTFRYRLKKLAGIAGIDLDDPETRFSLMLQLRLFHPTML